jgi:hypothetical protein
MNAQNLSKIKMPKIREFKIQNLLPILLILVIGGFFYRNWFLFKPLASGDWGYSFEENLKSLFDLPLTWSQIGLGNINIAARWAYPFDLLIGILARIFNLNFEVLEKLVFFWPFLLISLGSLYFFCRVFKLTNLFFLLASLFFLSNTYILMLVTGGQMLFALAVAFFPAVFAIFHQAVTENTWFKRLLAAVFLVILSVFDPRVTYLALIAVFIYYLFLLLVSPENRKNLLTNYAKIFLTVIPVFLGLLAYWWLPLVLTRDLGLPPGFGTLAQTKELSFATMANTITAFQPFYPENIFGKVSFTPFYFFLLPIFVFSTLILRSKDKLVLFFSFLALVGIFLAKGANEPLGEIYLFLNRFLPGFSFFRDPTKFYVLIILSYGVLLGIFAQEILTRIKKEYFRYGFLIIFAGLLVFLSKEAFLGKLNGTFQPREIPQEYQNYADKLSTDKSFYRAFWLPHKFTFAYFDDQHPAVDAWYLTEKKPISSFISHFYHRFTYLDSPAAPDFFDILGIRYLFVLDTSEQKFQNEKDREGTKKAQAKLVESLSQKDWLTSVNFFKNASGFENKNVSGKFWLVENLGLINGSDKVFETLATFPNFQLKNFALLPKNSSLANFSNAFLIIEDPKEKITQDYLAIIIYNLTSQNSDQKLAEIFLPKEGEYQFFIRTSKGPTIDFRQEEVPYGQVKSYFWQDLGIKFLTEGTNQINTSRNSDIIMLVPKDLLETFANSKQRKVEYQKISLTHYRVKISQRSEGILAFSEAFHPEWQAKINGREIQSYPLYGLINGFPIKGTIEDNQEILIEFLPQRIILPALGISIFTLVVTFLALVFSRRSK